MNLMSHKKLLIPIDEGVEMQLKALPKLAKNLYFGIYRCEITCNDPRFRFIFSFSKDKCYDYYAMKQAYKYQKQFDVKIKLIHDDKPNLLCYSEFITGEELFGNWCKVISTFKETYPKNKLIKHISASLWGTLSRKTTMFKTEKQIDDENISIGIVPSKCDWLIRNIFHKHNGNDLYELVSSKKNIYEYNIRLKTFLTSYGRNVCSELVMLDIDNVVRVYCDGVVFKKEQDINEINRLMKIPVKPEAKTTGLINWKNAAVRIINGESEKIDSPETELQIE
jgi:hypothetical protein